jgi:hypothetical protein
MDRCLRQAVAESKKPVRQWRPVPLPGDLLSRQCLPFSVGMHPVWLWKVHSDLALLEIALAVHMHRLETGRYPARLSEISRRWLPAIPLLPSGQPMAYELKDGRPVISAVEPDGKSRRVFGRLYARR